MSSSKNFGQRLLGLISLTIQHIAITISCAMCLILLFTWFARTSPWLELAAHFSVHSLITTLIVIPILWFTKHYRTAFVAIFVAICFAYFVQPWIFFPSTRTPKPELLRVLSWNVYATNEEFDSVVEVIRESNPDILVLVEVRPDLLDRAPWIKEQYPMSEVIPNWGGAGIAVFCRTDRVKYSVDFSVHDFATRVMPSIVAKLTSSDGSRQMELVATHTFSPSPPQRAIIRDKQLRSFLTWADSQGLPLCLVGDLNTTPWTRSFWELERAGFRDSRHGAGNCASWPAWLGPAGIPIDHAMTRGDCVINDRCVLSRYSGSDHRPIEFKLSF